MRRHSAEHCERLNATTLRALVPPEAAAHTLADGTQLRLIWQPVRGCFGGDGVALRVACPGCAAACRVLYRPAGRSWGCWRCHPLSWRSHRRSGSRRGRPKPTSWKLDQISAEQRRIADLLGLASWPPQRLIWSWRTLPLEARRPDAPRLSPEREQALRRRVCALETLRVAMLLPGIDAALRDFGHELSEWPGMAGAVAAAKRMVEASGWAMRRPAGDPRTPRRDARSGVLGTTAGIASEPVCDCYGTESGESEGPGLAHCATTDRVQSSKRWQSWQPRGTRCSPCESAAPNSRGSTASPKPRGCP